MQKLDSQTVQLIIVAAVAVTMLLQAIVLLAIFSVLRKSAQAMRQDIEELRTTVVPVIDNLRELLVHTGPKIEAAVVDIAAMSHNLRRQTADVQVAANGILDRLNNRERQIVTARFGLIRGREPLTLTQVGVAMGVTKERVRQIQVRAISRLREAAEESQISYTA